MVLVGNKNRVLRGNNMTLNEYSQEVLDYMIKKLPDVNQATLYEVTEFFVMKSNNFATDMIAENNTRWQEELKRYSKQMDG